MSSNEQTRTTYWPPQLISSWYPLKNSLKAVPPTFSTCLHDFPSLSSVSIRNLQTIWGGTIPPSDDVWADCYPSTAIWYKWNTSTHSPEENDLASISIHTLLRRDCDRHSRRRNNNDNSSYGGNCRCVQSRSHRGDPPRAKGKAGGRVLKIGLR